MTNPRGVGALSVVWRLFGSPAADGVWTAHGFDWRQEVNNAAAKDGAGWSAINREKVAHGAAKMRWQ
jgi:hypothetical protein